MIGQLISGGIGAVASIFATAKQNRLANEQRAKGEAQIAKGLKMQKDNPYQTPEEAKRALATAKSDVQGRNSLYQMKLDQADRTTGNSLGMMRNYANSGASGLAMVSQAMANENLQRGMAAEQAYEATEQRKAVLRERQDVSSGYADQEWKQNVAIPIAQNLNWGNENVAAAIQNKQNAWSNLAMTAASLGGAVGSAIDDGGGSRTPEQRFEARAERKARRAYNKANG